MAKSRMREKETLSRQLSTIRSYGMSHGSLLLFPIWEVI
nr:MAG TPA: hypothetical protein [Caudoviricetes sp.]